MQDDVCTPGCSTASKNLNREFCKICCTLLEPNAAEALPWDLTSQIHGFTQQMISRNIFSLCLTELYLHGKSFKKVLPSLPPKKFLSLLRKRASDTILCKMLEAANKWQQDPDSCLFSRKTVLCLTCGLLHFIILDSNAIFWVKPANSCRKGLVSCLDNHPQPHFRCKDFTAVWVTHSS